MKAVHFDTNGKQIAPHEASGIAGFTSWLRLAEIFRAAGELRDNERLLSFQVDDRGITFYVEHTR